MKTILVVDDDPGIRDVLAFLLEDAGYAVQAVPNALAALAAITRNAPDLVTTDLSMPGVNGLGLIRRLRCERPDLPVVVVSAAIRVSPPDGVPFVAKPFDSECLLATIAQLLLPDD